MLSRLSLAFILLCAAASAQVTPTSSIDPLSGTTFSTPVFTPATTFTPVTTFNSAGSRTPTSIDGPGPSVSSNSYTFSYENPLQTVSGTDLSRVYSSLAAHSTPTAATSPLGPDPTYLQIVNGNAAPGSFSGIPSLLALAGSFGVGLALVAMV
ncbi:hypothetical protein BDZ90DRAFT_229528 [Jaminaea rosea]|uniref:Uncharacterized protein n=1 Tax=Jaminaea rosea TaxID=1569628 RepID=A0A316UZ68_9BASI|nr:hypothetical protein BDZ90DRAFT_229528 [Jaminaea rosea]PWN30512.1 hypothetical protein BDZ90DRAFT_229528 [Jaminaea rosea]